MDKYAEAKEMARTCLGFTLEDGAEEIRLIAEYLSKVRNESAAEALNEAIRCVHLYWRFNDAQQNLSGWHDKSDLIETMMDDLAALRAGAGEDAG